MRLLTILALLLSLAQVQMATAQIDSTAYFEAEEYYEQLLTFYAKQQCDSANWAAQKSMDGFIEFEDWNLIVRSNVLISNCLFLMQEKEAFYEQVEYTGKLAKEKLSSDNNALPFIYNLLALASNEQGDYENAISYYLKAVEFDSLPSQSYGIFYSNLGLNYRLIGDYGEAIRYYEYGRDLILQSLEEDAESFHFGNLVRSINKIAKVYRLQGNYTKALDYYDQVDSLYRFMEVDNAYKGRIDCAHSMAYCYLGQNRPDLVSIQLERSSSLQAGRDLHQEEVRKEIIGELAFIEGDLDQAISHFQNALNIRKNQNKEVESQLRLSRRLADILTQQGKYGQAKLQLQSSLKLIAQSDANNPEDFIFPSLGIPLLAQMAELETEIANTQNELERIDSALNLYHRLKALIRFNRNSFKADNSRLFLASQTLPIYEKAISLCYHSYQQTKNKKYLEEAFAFSELGKATLLRESLQSNFASTNLSIPDSLRDKERNYQVDIAYFKEQLFLNPIPKDETVSDSTKQAVWRSKLFALENEYLELIEQLEREYPIYYHEKYRIQATNISNIQSILDNRQLLIEYFWGDKNLFIFKITANEVQLEKVAIEGRLSQVITRVQSFVSKPSATDQAYQQYQKDSYFLYEQLIGETSQLLHEDLIIIPDGPLGYLAFDALLTSAVNEADKLRYHELPYLLKKHRLYYQYSTALLLQAEKSKREASIAYGGFAPSYPALPNAQRGTQMVLDQPLSQLAFTKEEVNNTHAIWGGKTYINEAATKAVFLQNASQFKLLHLAMHGLLSGENTEFAALAFHPTSDSAGQFLLSMEEIAAMELVADLVVLSACETGSGRLRRGEGIMSMARAFREAGCPNILMSLWTADDKSSTLIMQDFFGRLKSGENIAESIRAAKIQLMSTQFLQSHPYYWAGFVPLGNPPNQKGNSHLLLILLLLLAGVGIGFMAYRTAEA